MENSPYPYQGYTITPSVAKWLIHKVLISDANEITHAHLRKDIHTKICDYHLQHGGKETPNSIFSLKKALALLKQEGKCENTVMVGYWRFKGASGDVENPNTTRTTPAPAPAPVPESKPSHLIIGTGDESVYLYWFPSFKALAEEKQETEWGCKIGCTRTDAVSRIKQQCSSASNGEYPVIGFIIKTHQSARLEKIIHETLTFQNKQLLDAYGKEWFKTNPEEVLNIYHFIQTPFKPKLASLSTSPT